MLLYRNCLHFHTSEILPLFLEVTSERCLCVFFLKLFYLHINNITYTHVHSHIHHLGCFTLPLVLQNGNIPHTFAILLNLIQLKIIPSRDIQIYLFLFNYYRVAFHSMTWQCNCLAIPYNCCHYKYSYRVVFFLCIYFN